MIVAGCHARQCAVEGCVTRVYCRDWCLQHYRRFVKYGSPHICAATLRAARPVPTCKVTGCTAEAHARGLCRLHYKRLYTHGTTERRPPPVRAERAKCAVQECQREALCKGLCSMHYTRLVKKGNLGPPHPIALRRPKADACSIPGCERRHMGSGLCNRHYKAEYRRRPDAKRCGSAGCERVASARGLCDLHHRRANGIKEKKVWPVGTRLLANGGYVKIRCAKGDPLAAGKLWPLEHRYVMARQLGRPLLPTEQVHHKNGNKADNSPENLELWNGSQPPGQRVEDLLAWARSIIALYSAS